MNEFEFDDNPPKGQSLETTKIQPDSDQPVEIDSQEKSSGIELAKKENVPIREKPAKLIFGEWRNLSKETLLRNFYSALSITFVTFPFALIMVVNLNDVAPEPILTYAGSIMNNIVGFISVLIYSKGAMLFRTFTGLLFPILADSVKEYGKEGLATTMLYIIVLLSLGILFNLFRVIKYIPFFIFESVKIGIGVLMIFSEVYSLLGIKSKGKETTLINFFGDFSQNSDKVKFAELGVCLALGFAMFFAQKRFKQFPWTAVVFALGILCGYYIHYKDPEGKTRVRLLRDLAPAEFEQDNSSLFSFDKDFIPTAFRGLRHPLIFLNSFGILIMILFEVCISIAINEDWFEKKVKRKQELFGVTCSNAVCFFFGILPLSVPIGKVQYTLETGATHKIFNLYCVIITLVLYFLFFTATGYVPLCMLKSMNVPISLNLIKLSFVREFLRYSPYYAWGMGAIILGMLLLNMAWCVMIAVAVFMIFYFTQVKEEANEYLDRGDGSVEVVLKGRFVFMRKSEVIKELKARNARAVILNFGACIVVEINYARNYKELLREVEKNFQEVKLVGLEKGKLTASIKNVLLKKMPFFKKYLTQQN